MPGRTEVQEQLYFQVQDLADSSSKDKINFNAANSISLVMGFKLGRERILSLLGSVAGSGSVANSIDYYVNALKPEDITALYAAMGYVFGSVLVPDLMHTYLEPWSTRDFFNSINSRLDPTPIPTLRLENYFEENSDMVSEVAKLDRIIGDQIRKGFEGGRKVNRFFESLNDFGQLGTSRLIYNYGGENLVISTFNAGGDFLDVLGRFPVKQTRAINFLEGLED